MINGRKFLRTPAGNPERILPESWMEGERERERGRERVVFEHATEMNQLWSGLAPVHRKTHRLHSFDLPDPLDRRGGSTSIRPARSVHPVHPVRPVRPVRPTVGVTLSTRQPSR